ncbi:hypothetical protein M9H77_15172 [Catharanthus roseus]|uniref:Uncharacterized protein n=1 Tax=Catharanthus roseus TaxID=4058 RepID=A0ACC0BQB2_CATRO|nr:hypothetical protein M9H77_15172 [Catharanthus roseus]
MNTYKIIMFFIILTIFKGESHNNDTNTNIPNKNNEKSPSKCAKEQIEVSIQETETKCKEFVKNEIQRRLDDPTLIEEDVKCLTKCVVSYQVGIVSLSKAVTEVSAGLFPQAIGDVTAFTVSVAPCMACCVKLASNDPVLIDFQRWALKNALEANQKLESCIIINP